MLKNENVCLKDDDKYGSVTEYSIDIDDIVKGSIVKIKYILHFPFDYIGSITIDKSFFSFEIS